MTHCIQISVETSDLLGFGFSFVLRPSASVELVALQLYFDPVLLLQAAKAAAICDPLKLCFGTPPESPREEAVPTTQIINAEPHLNSALFDELLARIRAGLDTHVPELCHEGVNGTYFMRDEKGKVVGIFKPQDEEGNSPDNPKKTESLSQSGVRPGEAAAREVAASILDEHCDNIFGVPITRMVHLTHPVFGKQADGSPRVKTGSLQEFVENDGVAGDMGPGSFPVEEVQRLAVLDMLLYNTDRHEGNILYKKSNDDTKLIPIDHGFSLPDRLGSAWFDWIHYPQAKKPLTPSLITLINNLDVETLCSSLSSLIRPECLGTLRICANVVKSGAAKGKSVQEIGWFMSRKNHREECILEKIMAEKKNEERFMEEVFQAIKDRM